MNISALREIEEALVKATGLDRELDTDIMAACFDWAQRGSPYLAPHCVGEEPIYWHAPEPYYKRRVPKLTASLDAAIGVVCELFSDRLLAWDIGFAYNGGPYSARIYFLETEDVLGRDFEIEETHCASAPLALCFAIIRALISQHEAEGEK